MRWNYAQLKRLLFFTGCVLLLLASQACSSVPANAPTSTNPALTLSTPSSISSPQAPATQPALNTSTPSIANLPATTSTGTNPSITAAITSLAGTGQSVSTQTTNTRQFDLLADLDNSSIGAIQEVFWQPGTQNLLVQSTRQLFLLNPMNGEIRWELQSHFNQLVFTADGRELMAMNGNEIKRLDPTSGETRSTFQLPDTDGLSVISPDGQSIASTVGGDITLTDLQTNQSLILPTDLNSGPVADLAFSGDGKWLIAGSQNGDVQAWDAETGQLTRFQPAEIGADAYECFVSGALDNQPTGTLVIICSYPTANYQTAIYQVGIYNAGANAPGSTFEIRDSGLRGYNTFTVNADRSRVAVLGGEQIEIWNPAGSNRLRVLNSASGQGMAFNPKAGNQLALWSQYAIAIWDISSGQRSAEWRVPGIAEPVIQMMFSPAPGRRVLIVGRKDGLLESWDVATMQKTAGWQGEAISALAFSDDGSWLVIGEQSGRVALFDMSAVGFFPEKEFQVGFAVNDLAFAPGDSSRLYIAGKSHHIHLWDVTQGGESAILQGSNLFELNVFDLNANILAAGTISGRIVIWNTIPQQEPFLVLAFSNMSPILSVLVSPNGRQVIFTQSNYLKIWDIQTKKAVREISFRNANGVIASLSPDGCILAIQTQKSLELLDILSLESLAQLETSPQSTGALVFSSDGLILAAADNEGGMRLWGAAGALQSPNGTAPASLCQSIPSPTPTASRTARPSATFSPSATPGVGTSFTLAPSATQVVSPTATPTPPSFARVLSLSDPYMRGDDVYLLQERLVALGYSAVGVPDGVFGPKTDEAVRLFQERNGLVVDGFVGPMTWQHLFASDAARP